MYLYISARSSAFCGKAGVYNNDTTTSRNFASAERFIGVVYGLLSGGSEGRKGRGELCRPERIRTAQNFLFSYFFLFIAMTKEIRFSRASSSFRSYFRGNEYKNPFTQVQVVSSNWYLFTLHSGVPNTLFGSFQHPYTVDFPRVIQCGPNKTTST